jgi:hypothetical protein
MDLDAQVSQTENFFDALEAKGAKKIPSFVAAIFNQLAKITSSMEANTEIMRANTAANRQTSNSLNSLVDTIANIELQMASIRRENETLKGQMAKLEEKIKTLENRPTATPQRTFANVVSHGLPPRPECLIVALPNKPAGKESSVGKHSNVGKLARSPYPKAAR